MRIFSRCTVTRLTMSTAMILAGSILAARSCIFCMAFHRSSRITSLISFGFVTTYLRNGHQIKSEWIRMWFKCSDTYPSQGTIKSRSTYSMICCSCRSTVLPKIRGKFEGFLMGFGKSKMLHLQYNIWYT